jgi:hypothetical protein
MVSPRATTICVESLYVSVSDTMVDCPRATAAFPAPPRTLIPRSLASKTTRSPW